MGGIPVSNGRQKCIPKMVSEILVLRCKTVKLGLLEVIGEIKI